MKLFQPSSKKRSEHWLIWRSEGEATVSDLMQSKEFTYNVGTSSHQPFHIVETMILRERGPGHAIIQTIMRHLLFALDGLHWTGIVHRE
ncbi:hypothetical protein I3843_05G022600 [Carya illinoinensis]|nr:hypothetical protein I3843_05G022600 [Carya illinoinensis]